ncbi:hypothetical protein F442_16969 [Phytophthora nicotianae P10297]|uniref:Uncharacterized protein n=3 Tax=Phytophthora nicotianae TaxID=4792 RepID=V9EFL6_PHYNI|nr:hypothetical protein F443_17110 [Phytophthora nicotianae P1569]ETL83721.1 hypothetical protein L917_16364 [Phytophthora nicotianae]ETP34742.1 hypothetical protein F442_16969 [Phytophthora nicotianae P10297]
MSSSSKNFSNADEERKLSRKRLPALHKQVI